MPLGRFTQTYRNIQRLREIANVALKHGLGHLIEQLNLQYLVTLGRRLILLPKSQPPEVHTLPERLRLFFEELGPSFIKLGQLLSSRPDLIPRDFAQELKKLQDNVPPFPFSAVKTQIETSLQQSLDELFLSFEPKPFAAASIAQVHYATLKTGEEVVVKVQRPGLRRLVETDISILFYLAQLLERYLPEVQRYNPTGIVEEYARTIRKELNFNQEASNATRFRENFAGDDTVYIPRVYWDYTTEQVLTMERVAGIPIDEVGLIEEQGWDRREIARRGAHAFLKQWLIDGFFHADPHPGNFLLQNHRGPHTKAPVIAFMDFGMVGRLDREMIDNLADTFLALMNRDYEALARGYLRMGLVPREVDLKGFINDLQDLVEPYYSRSLAHAPAGRIVYEIFHLALEYQVRFPTDFLLLAKSLLIVEGIAQELDPELSLLELAAPYAREIWKRRLDPQRLVTDAFRAVGDVSEVARELPTQVNQVLNKLLHSELKVELLHRGIDEMIREIDASSSRLSLSLLLAALIIGSSLLMLSGQAPFLFGFPLLGLIGYLLAGCLGIWLIISFLRRGRF